MLKRLSLILVLILVILSISIPVPGFDNRDQKIADVVIYSGVGAWNEGVVAFEKFLDFKGLSWFECDDSYIEENILIGNFDVIHFPGGNSGYYSDRINGVGIQNIQDFISSGGGYIGICAGGYFACDRVEWEGNTYEHPLKLFDGVGYGAIDEIASWPNYAMTTININSTNPINQYEPSSEYTMYYGGAAYYPDENQEMNVIATYESFYNNPAMINFNFGSGRVILIGPHIEIEEDSTRDDVSFADDLDDFGTDWNLLWTCLDWLMELPISEPPANSPTDIPVISGEKKIRVGREYDYTFSSRDPESEEVYFYIEWGDGHVEEWSGPFRSSDEAIFSHIFTDKENNIIKAKAKDCNGEESDWEEFEISFPRNKLIPVPKLFRYLGFLLNQFSKILNNFVN